MTVCRSHLVEKPHDRPKSLFRMMPYALLCSHLMDTSADSDSIHQLIHTASPVYMHLAHYRLHWNALMLNILQPW